MSSLWIHGWATDSRVFGPLIAALPPELAATVRAVDLPGYGPQTPAAHGIDNAAWLADQIHTDINRGPLVLGGWSMGAMLALEAAAARPRDVSALVLISGCARFVRGASNPYGQDPRRPRAMLHGLRRDSRRVVENFLAGIFAPEEQESAAAFQILFGEDYRKINPTVLADGLNYLLEVDLEDRLAGITCPVLLLHGSADTVIDLRLAEKLAAALPDARLEVLDGAGHAPQWPRSKECAGLIAEFIDSSGQRGGE